jgi:hypothetical protein
MVVKIIGVTQKTARWQRHHVSTEASTAEIFFILIKDDLLKIAQKKGYAHYATFILLFNRFSALLSCLRTCCLYFFKLKVCWSIVPTQKIPLRTKCRLHRAIPKWDFSRNRSFSNILWRRSFQRSRIIKDEQAKCAPCIILYCTLRLHPLTCDIVLRFWKLDIKRIDG